MILYFKHDENGNKSFVMESEKEDKFLNQYCKHYNIDIDEYQREEFDMTNTVIETTFERDNSNFSSHFNHVAFE